MTTQTLPLFSNHSEFVADNRAAAPMLGRAFALMNAATARRAAEGLRREATLVGDRQSRKYQELTALANAIEASKR